MNRSKRPRRHIKAVTVEKVDKFRVEAQTGDYILSQQQTGSHNVMPRRTDAPEIQLVWERRILEEIDDELAAKRSFYAKERKNLQRQWDDLEMKETNLKRSFQYFNKFVKENMEKRERASKKVGEDRHLRDERTKDVEELQERIDKLHESGKNLERILRKHLIYEGYLNELVKDNPSEFKTVDDILNRYESLFEARIKLLARQEDAMADLEHHIRKFMKMSNENNLLMLGLNNILAHLEERYKHVNEYTLEKEMLVQKVKIAFISKTAEVESVKTQMYKMYTDICCMRNIPSKLRSTDYEGLLLFIKKSIIEMVNMSVGEKKKKKKK